MTEMEYRPVQVPGSVSQATSIEQSRAAMQVVAQVQAARMMPRSVAGAVSEMEQACKSPQLAAKAFYSFPRGGQRVTGPTVELARMLQRCWGNIDAGTSELSRNELDGTSEMMAWAWDLEKNNRVSTTFIVLHRRDTKDGPKVLTDSRDVYETNANNAARREREMILRVVPEWFRDQAIDLCQQTLNNRGAKQPMRIEQQRARAVEAYDGVGVSLAQLERRVGKPLDAWTTADMADLNVLFREVEAGHVDKYDVFGQAPITDADLKQAPKQGPDGRAASWGAVQYMPQEENPAGPASGREDLHLWTEEQIQEQFPGAYREGPELIVPRKPVGEEWPPVRQPGGE